MRMEPKVCRKEARKKKRKMPKRETESLRVHGLFVNECSPVRKGLHPIVCKKKKNRPPKKRHNIFAFALLIRSRAGKQLNLQDDGEKKHSSQKIRKPKLNRRVINETPSTGVSN